MLIWDKSGETPAKYKCLGHHKSYHTVDSECSKLNGKCPGHSTYDNEWMFHGDPCRE